MVLAGAISITHQCPPSHIIASKVCITLWTSSPTEVLQCRHSNLATQGQLGDGMTIVVLKGLLTFTAATEPLTLAYTATGAS
eukprot:4695480-Pleurochrysis_carterae.AAC.7